jgi:hypothetical protein
MQEPPQSPEALPLPPISSSPPTPTGHEPAHGLLPLPPPAPDHSIWQCCECRHIYRFSAVRNRCLLCSHWFCKRCVDGHDYSGWDRYTSFWASLTPPTAWTEASSDTSSDTSSETDSWEDEPEHWNSLEDGIIIGEEVYESGAQDPESPRIPRIPSRGNRGWRMECRLALR